MDFTVFREISRSTIIITSVTGFSMSLMSLLVILLFLQIKKNREMQKVLTGYTEEIHYNKLTGLPNRQKLLIKLNENKTPVLFLININNFKKINEYFGPNVGDMILVSMARKIMDLQPHKDNGVYKLNADEYALIIYGEDKPVPVEKIIMLADNLVLSTTVSVLRAEDCDFHVKVTIGIAFNDTINSIPLIASADSALKEAKRTNRAYMIYNMNDNRNDIIRHNINCLKSLTNAIDDDRITPWFQPIVNSSNGKIEKYECLVRLIEEDGSVVSPYNFLDISKSAKLYSRITRIMFDKSLAMFSDKPYKFSFNLSVNDIIDPIIVQYLKLSILANPGVKNKVIFEIVESEGIENYCEVLDFIKDMKILGCEIAIDDFGTGYSNFEYIANIKADYLKIDGSLIKNIKENRQHQIIVDTINDVAHKLGIKTVAEYVESSEISSILNTIGIDYHQGYHYGKPESYLL
jgi:diguanylate cyclase (GGDEF)-like protein